MKINPNKTVLILSVTCVLLLVLALTVFPWAWIPLALIVGSAAVTVGLLWGYQKWGSP